MNDIGKKQNETWMLKIQYAARHYYNVAETLDAIVWICCIISALFILLPGNIKFELTFMAIPFFLDLIAAFLNWSVIKTVKVASLLRRFFDSYVLNIEFDQLALTQELKEYTTKANSSNREKALIQITNTGYDKPPGVKDWYEITETVAGHDAIFECQKQNCWWNKKMFTKRIIFTIILLIILIGISIFLYVLSEKSVLHVILCSGGIILKLIERTYANIQYFIVSNKIDGALDILAVTRLDESITRLQYQINNRRSLPVLEKNWIYRKNAKKLSELYADTNITK